ncbi:cistern family PEP-CTERM protein [Leptolyngbya sp. FACHB-541]|uniref:cistern family PEP-CTERM protein n=1 Tax=Leptolyngbya sp. FACHB-541 TaxID=2692810 RepID=UPI00168A35D1|nr:cistern family PEP-CTERM protein [Leptolyngbya sp. FACHB-541]MBD2001054.1 cistern family PEP-CTERM protein [Leptolyngbya sp. FACHB-541]
MKKHLLTGVLALGTLTVTSFLQSAPAQALSFNGSNVTIDSVDAGQSFLVNFDGNVEKTNIPGLTSQATFTFNGFTTVGTRTEAAFTVLLKNISSITSRTSALGFDVPNFTLNGVGNDSGALSGRTRVSGLFTNDRGGSLPNGFGNIEVCFTSGPTCQGGASGGVFNNSSGTFNLVLALNSNNQTVNSLTLNNFGVRYQSIQGVIIDGKQQTSGTGRGTPTPVPTPALIPAALGMSAALLRKKKQEEEAEKA